MPLQRPPVLVAGAESPTGLGVARALRDEGLTILGLTNDPTASTCRSGLWSGIVDEGEGTAAWMEAVRGVVARHGRTVLIPVRDDIVELVADHADELEPLVDFVLPPADVVTTLLDKTAFHEWAAKHGFPVPHTEIVADERELATALARMPYPAVLKPYERTAAWQAASPRHKAYRLESAADVARAGLPPLFELAPRFVLQQWIPGTDADVWFCLTYRDRSGREVASQVGRKLVQWPVGTGCTALATTAEDAELRTLTQELFDAAGHVGVGSLEVKRNTVDGRLYITEPTVGRPNLQSNVATAAGVNLTLLQYRDALGLDLPAQPAPRPALWVHETSLPRAMAVAAARRVLDVRSIAGALRGGPRRMAAFAATGDRTPLTAELRRFGTRAASLAAARVRRH